MPGILIIVRMLQGIRIEKRLSLEKNRGMGLKKILVSIDGSRSSINALKYAVKMARLLQAEIVGIHVINETSYSEYYQEISNKLKKKAEGVLKRVVDAVQKEGAMIRYEFLNVRVR